MRKRNSANLVGKLSFKNIFFAFSKLALAAYVLAILAWSWNTQAQSNTHFVDFNEETPLVPLTVKGGIQSSPRMGTFMFVVIDGELVQIELRNQDGGMFVPEDLGYDFSELNQAQVQVQGFAVVNAETAQFTVGPAIPEVQNLNQQIRPQHNRPPHITQPVQPRTPEIKVESASAPFILGYSANGLAQGIILVDSLVVEPSL